MGFINNDGILIPVPLQLITPTVGTWTMTPASNLWTLVKTAGANTSILHAPFPGFMDSAYRQSMLIKYITLWWINATANLTDLSVIIQKASLPNQAGTHSRAALAGAYDSAHDTAAKRYTQAQHKMIYTLTDPVWVGNADDLNAEITVNAAATSAIKLQAVAWGITFRS